MAIVDPKIVQKGILNRCMYLEDEDVEKNKAEVLAARAQPDFPKLRLTPRVSDFKAYVRGLGRPPETVLVTVDSRHVRRSIQLAVPQRIIDASTTDVRGVVVHSNVLPTKHACLACIYRHVPEEHAREQSIADGLGVDLADVRSGLITEEIARRIVKTHPSIDTIAITGTAFDSPLPAAVRSAGLGDTRRSPGPGSIRLCLGLGRHPDGGRDGEVVLRNYRH